MEMDLKKYSQIAFIIKVFFFLIKVGIILYIFNKVFAFFTNYYYENRELIWSITQETEYYLYQPLYNYKTDYSCYCNRTKTNKNAFICYCNYNVSKVINSYDQ